jgi:hydrogenase maturation factor
VREKDPLPSGKLGPELLAGLLHGIRPDPSVLVGPGVGRDVAVVDAGGGRCWILTADPITFATDEIGHYAVAVNVNDVACAGAIPRWFLATLLLPEGAATGQLARRIQEQIQRACERQGIALVGGHTEVTRGIARPIVCGALVGEVAKADLVRSDGGRPGDAILLTRGLALEGTALLAREKRAELAAAGFEDAFLARCAGFLHEPGIGVLPAARAALGAGGVHALHDPTEGGLSAALWELAGASGLDLRVDPAAIPVLPETRRLCRHLGLEPLGLIASGALLALVDPACETGVRAACEAVGIPCARIGEALGRSSGEAHVLDGTSGHPLARFVRDELARAFG